MKIPPVKIKKIIPVKKIITKSPFPVVVIDAALSGLEAIIVPPDIESLTANGQLKLTLRTRNRRIKKLAEALLAAHAGMHSFTQRQEALHEELQNVNEEVVSNNEELQRVNDELQMRNDLLNESYDYSEAIIATIHEPMIILTGDLRVKSANTSFYENFRVRKEDTEGALLYDLGNKQWNIPALRELLENIIPKNTHFQDFEVIHTFPGIGEKIMLLNASRIVQKSHGTQLILLAIEDVTEVRKKTRELQQRDKELFNKNVSEQKAEKQQLENLVEARTNELARANKELVFQNGEKEKRATELIIANKELAFQNEEKEKRASELIIANKELFFENEEKEKRAAELLIANKELAFQNEEKEKRAAELRIANSELIFQNGEKEKKAIELIFQNEEKEKRAAELFIANNELAFQNEEKEKRATELIIANSELAFQNEEKEKRAAELIIANKELGFENDEKGKRAAELIIANKELAFQNEEKEKRAAELRIANSELIFQNGEKEKRAIELIFQNEEKEKRAAELILANKELESFTYIASHDLQEPLRKIQTFAGLILKEDQGLSGNCKDYLARMKLAGMRMQTLIEDLLAYSRINATERKFEKTALKIIIEDIEADLKEAIDEKRAVITTIELCEMCIIVFQFRQLMYNLISNALKFSHPERPLHITITSSIVQGSELDNEKLLADKSYCHVRVADNGIGFDPQYKSRIFEVFQKLHGQKEYAGTGIGLAIVKKIVDNHNGIIIATGELNIGASFDIYIPVPVV